MICNKCGRKNDNSAIKCKHCGAKLNKVNLTVQESDKDLKSKKLIKWCLILDILSFCLSALSIFFSLFMIIPIIALVLAILSINISLKYMRYIKMSIVSISVSSAAFALNLYWFVMIVILH